MQADAYAGFTRLYEANRKPGPIVEAACWAHGRRKFFDLARSARRRLRSQQRVFVRQQRSRPLVGELHAWLRE
jgi:transposase